MKVVGCYRAAGEAIGGIFLDELIVEYRAGKQIQVVGH